MLNVLIMRVFMCMCVCLLVCVFTCVCVALLLACVCGQVTFTKFNMNSSCSMGHLYTVLRSCTRACAKIQLQS